MDAKLGGRGGVKSEINVTPLVDVCLVLLIIFMVVTPLLDSGRAELPETRLPAALPQTAGQLEVSIQQDGKVFVGEDPVSEDRLLTTLQAVHQRRPDADVVVKADHRLKFESVRQVLEVINEAGFSGAGLATRKKGAGA